MMKDYYQQSMRALQFAEMSNATQKGHTCAVRMLVDFCGKTPNLVTEQELQDYFLHRRNKGKWSAATMRIKGRALRTDMFPCLIKPFASCVAIGRHNAIPG